MYKSFMAHLFGSCVYFIAVFAIKFQTSEAIAFVVMARLKYIEASMTIGIEGRNIPLRYLVVMKMLPQSKNARVGFVCKCCETLSTLELATMSLIVTTRI